MDPIDPRRLRPRVGQFEGEHRLRAIMAEQARAMNLFVVAIVIAACIGLVVYAACVGLSRAEAAYQIERRV